MAESKTGARLVAALLGAAAVAAGAWWLVGAQSERTSPTGPPQTPAGAPPGAEAPAADAPAAGADAGTDAAEEPAPRIVSGGRLSLDAASLPEDAPLALTLELEDAARGSGEHSARIVSVDGRVLDLVATPRPGEGAGLRLDVDPAFLSRGRYMIQIETSEGHPLRIRRYVLEIR